MLCVHRGLEIKQITVGRVTHLDADRTRSSVVGAILVLPVSVGRVSCCPNTTGQLWQLYKYGTDGIDDVYQCKRTNECANVRATRIRAHTVGEFL